MKKSEIVRLMIKTAKANGIGLNDLIPTVMDQVGFTRQLARLYVKNNWSKVEVEVEQPKVTATAMPKRQPRELSMTPSAIRKREQRARAKLQTA